MCSYWGKAKIYFVYSSTSICTKRRRKTKVVFDLIAGKDRNNTIQAYLEAEEEKTSSVNFDWFIEENQDDIHSHSEKKSMEMLESKVHLVVYKSISYKISC